MKSPVPLKVVDLFVAAAHLIAESRLLSCASGNLSSRLADGRMLVTATGSWLGRLTRDEVAVCQIRDGSPVSGCAPSKEIGFHAGILALRPEVNVVLHFQSAHATAVACSRPRARNYFVVPEVPYYLGEIGWVPYLPPGSRELADAVVAACRTHELAIMRNHGQVTVGASYDDVLQNALVFEQACKVMLLAGRELRPLPPAGVTALLAEGARARAKRV